ncbi:MAG: sensor histidine kinase [Desulfatiglandales bacterium]
MNPSQTIAAFYHIFRDVSRSVHSSTSVEEVLDLVVSKVTEALKAKGAVLRILNLETNELELNAAYGLSGKYLSKGHVSSHKVITELCRQNKVLIIEDVETDPRVQYPGSAREEGIQMMVDLPLSLRNSIVGVLRIFFPQKRKFSEEEINFTEFIAEQCAMAIDKARLIETQQNRYDHLALQTEKLSSLGRMAAGIAHEINNPLAGILLYSTNLVKKVPQTGPLREGLDIIIHETIRCRGIIQELLEFSREKEPKKISADINEIIIKALNILENEFRLRHIRLEKDLAEGMPKALLDVDQMEQVFINLLLNGVEAMQEEGTIRIRTRIDLDKKRLVVEVEDTGCGISPENLGKIFDPFFSTKPKGSGLGLAVNYGIIEKHGGNIRVSSKLGRGTCFTIAFPAGDETSGSPPH